MYKVCPEMPALTLPYRKTKVINTYDHELRYVAFDLSCFLLKEEFETLK